MSEQKNKTMFMFIHICVVRSLQLASTIAFTLENVAFD